MKPCVCYFRVSTSRQGITGLGMDAQRHLVETYLRSGAYERIGEFAEAETGRRADRPELEKALRLCREKKAVLMIATLSRLARNAAFTLALRDSGVEFVCCDMPDANRLTIGILAVVAEDEAHRISERTKAALAAARRRGIKLGNPSPQKASRLAIAANQLRADTFAKQMIPVIQQLRKAHVVSLKETADCLNARGIRTRRGGQWYPQSVSNLLSRLSSY